MVGRNAWYFQLRSAGMAPEAARAEAGARGQELFPKGNLLESLAASARMWQTWALVAVYFTTFGGFTALTAWLPKYWNSLHGVSLATAGTLAGATILSINGGLPLSVAAIVLMALGMGVGNAAVFKMVPHYLPHAVGGAAGWVGGLGAFGGFVIPNLLTAFLSTGEAGDPNYARGFVVFAALAAVSLAIVVVLRRHRSRS